MRTLLDTQILIWALQEPEKVNAKTRALIDLPDNEIYISCISIFEIEQKKNLGKLTFDHDLKRLLDEDYFFTLDLKMKHVFEVKHLPLIHRDPFDRLMIAQSISEGIPLLTADRIIQQYDFNHVKA